MAIQSADKIFIDTNDEINFVVEKILQAKQDRVVVAVPQNALVVSSLVSMKILAKQVVKSKKLVIIVTEDRFGMQLAERAGLISTAKVSGITPEMWEVAQIKKERFRTDLEEHKKELLTNRGILPAQESTQARAENEKEGSAEPDSEAVPQPEPEAQLDLQAPEESKVDQEDPELVTEPEETEELKGPIQRKRREAKVVSVGAFQVFAGGDLASQPSAADTNDANIDAMDEYDEDSLTESSAKKDKPSGGFTGRDWTSATRSAKPAESGLAAFSPFKRGAGEGSSPVDKLKAIAKSKKTWAVVVLMASVLGVAVYVLAFVLASVEVRLQLKTASVPVEQQITADPAYLDIDVENLIIPASVLEEEVNGSTTGRATGEGSTGQKAAGLIEIWNRTSAEIRLSSGTVLTNPTNSLKYILQEAVTLPPAQTDSNGVITSPGGVNQEVRVEAEKFGTEYNIPASDDTSVDLKLDGFATSDVVGKRFRDITGGTTENFVTVSQADVDRDKADLRKKLESQALTRLRTLVGPDQVLLAGSEQYEEVELKPSPDFDQKADNEQYTLNMELKITAIVVKKEDLDSAIAELISRNQESEVRFEVDSLSGSAVANVNREGDKVTFTVSSRGSLRSKIDVDQIKRDIAGMSLDEAKTYFDFDVAEVESSRIIYYPGLVPDFLRRVPNDPNKVVLVY